jgi:regulator of RNase E activity RraA
MSPRSSPQRKSAPWTPPLAEGELRQLGRWNTPTIYNGLEQYTRADRRALANLEEVRDFMPQMGPMVGWAVTVQVEPSNPKHTRRMPDAASRYRRYLASLPGPKIVVVQDLDKPRVMGSFWGEVGAGVHRAFGCVGTITDGGVRDLDEMTCAGFKALARRTCVGHAWSTPVRWGCEVEVFGSRVRPGQLIHADKHGFLVVPLGEEAQLFEAARFMDANECSTVIPAAAASAGRGFGEILDGIDRAAKAFGAAARAKFGRKGEW